MLDETFVTAVATLAQRALNGDERITVIDDIPMSTTPLHDARPKLPEPAPLVTHTLTGLSHYINANRDGVELEECVLHVVSPTRVELRGSLTGDFRQRFTFARAEAFDRFAAYSAFSFGRWLPVADMVIAVQALFEDTDARAGLLKLLGGIRNVAESATEDDGVTQRVAVKSGIHLVNETAAQPQWVLRPYRTFPEVEQPASPFVLRLKQDGSDVRAALFEADGGAWQLEAIRGVAEWLAAKAVTVVIVA